MNWYLWCWVLANMNTPALEYSYGRRHTCTNAAKWAYIHRGITRQKRHQFGAVAQLVARGKFLWTLNILWNNILTIIQRLQFARLSGRDGSASSSFFASFSILHFTFHCSHFPNILFFFLEVVITFYIACANSASHIGEANNVPRLCYLRIYAWGV